MGVPASVLRPVSRLIVLALLLAGCAQQEAPAQTAPSGGAGQSGQPTAATSGEPRGTLNVIAELGTERWLLRTATQEQPLWNIGEPLVWWDWANDKPTNEAILQSWDSKVNPDGSTDWTLKIKKGIKFQKGWGEVTADDIKFSLTEFLKPGSVNANAFALTTWFGKNPDNLIVQDPYTLLVKSPVTMNTTELLRAMSPEEARSLRPFSKKYFEQVGEEEFAKNPVFAGPYEFVSNTPGYDVTLKAVPDFYRTKPGFATIHYVKVPDEASRMAMLQSGQVDIVSVPGRLVKQVQSSGVKIAISENAIEPFIGLGGLYPGLPNYDPNFPWTGPDPLGENPTKVRKALNLAVDRQTIVDKILFGYGSPGVISFSFLGPSFPWWNPDWKPIPFDVPQAKKLLSEAGYPNCFEFNMWIISGQTYGPDIGEAIASMWEKNLGCKVNRRVGEYTPTFRTMLVDRNTNGWAWDFEGGPIARPTRYACLNGGPSYQVVVHQQLPFFDEICKQADKTQDPAELLKLEKQLGDLEYKYFPTVSCCVVNATFGIGPKVKSWTPMPKKSTPGNLEYAQPN